MSASFVGRSLKIIGVFETYNSDLSLEKWMQLTREAKAELPEEVIVTPPVMVKPPAGEELPELVELFLEAERRRFPFYSELEEISVKDLAQQCAEIARQMRSRARGAL